MPVFVRELFRIMDPCSSVKGGPHSKHDSGHLWVHRIYCYVGGKIFQLAPSGLLDDISDDRVCLLGLSLCGQKQLQSNSRASGGVQEIK